MSFKDLTVPPLGPAVHHKTGTSQGSDIPPTLTRPHLPLYLLRLLVTLGKRLAVGVEQGAGDGGDSGGGGGDVGGGSKRWLGLKWPWLLLHGELVLLKGADYDTGGRATIPEFWDVQIHYLLTKERKVEIERQKKIHV